MKTTYGKPKMTNKIINYWISECENWRKEKIKLCDESKEKTEANYKNSWNQRKKEWLNKINNFEKEVIYWETKIDKILKERKISLKDFEELYDLHDAKLTKINKENYKVNMIDWRYENTQKYHNKKLIQEIKFKNSNTTKKTIPIYHLKTTKKNKYITTIQEDINPQEGITKIESEKIIIKIDNKKIEIN